MRMATASRHRISATATVMAEGAAPPAANGNGSASLGGGAQPAAPLPAAPLPAAALQKLMAWLSPAFPVGAFSYSHGLEWEVEDGTIRDAATLSAWLGDVLAHGAGRSDAILFVHAWRAVAGADHAALQSVAELGAALQPSKERHLEATAQGRAFLSAVLASWPNRHLAAAAESLSEPPVYAIAVAIAAASHEVPLNLALSATLQAFAANLVSAGVRAIPIGQTDGQRVIAALIAPIEATAAAALAARLDDIGGVALRADIASMHHETQYTRLFRS